MFTFYVYYVTYAELSNWNHKFNNSGRLERWIQDSGPYIKGLKLVLNHAGCGIHTCQLSKKGQMRENDKKRGTVLNFL